MFLSEIQCNKKAGYIREGGGGGTHPESSNIVSGKFNVVLRTENKILFFALMVFVKLLDKVIGAQRDVCVMISYNLGTRNVAITFSTWTGVT